MYYSFKYVDRNIFVYKLYIMKFIYLKFITWTWLTGPWRLPGPMTCHLRAGDPVPGPESQRVDGVDSCENLKARKSRAPRAGKDRCPSPIRQTESESSLPPPFCSIRPSADAWCTPHTHTPHWGSFTQSTNPNANLFQKHPHRHTQIWASRDPTSWHIILTIRLRKK